ncbi:MAG: leucine-rich repeat protein [Paludibacter sp.]|nr:leucine-rich repeat protein [Bacteroidales bacterium]MCM1069345.1 leucine-rich repeat protein [Prevotella sp.]MCM1353865.1 leucine-rich repeat protein [Bacteroides sp.]MCM1442885.1 leucine-rich repeat protein [Muribaculum sp.]MCM1481930.1 leucine-rich repeat protein [Paludibacter sp.]
MKKITFLFLFILSTCAVWGVGNNFDAVITEGDFHYLIYDLNTDSPYAAIFGNDGKFNCVFTAGEAATRNNLFIQDLTIPGSIDYNGHRIPVTIIGRGAFMYEKNITGTLTLPASVTTIESYAFAYCYGLTALQLNDGLISIEDHAFFFESSLPGSFRGDLKLPNTLTTIGSYAFSWAFYLDRYATPYKTLNLPSSLQTMGDNAFQGCWGFGGTLRIPGSLKRIPYYAFMACARFSEIVIEKGVEHIDLCAFRQVGVGYTRQDGTKGLERVTIPRTVQQIGNPKYNSSADAKLRAFYLTDIAVVDIYAETPPIMYGQQFENTTLQNGTFIVPCNTTEDYRQAEYWQDIAEGHIWGLEDDINGNPSIVSTKVTCNVSPVEAGTAHYTWDCAKRMYRLSCTAHPDYVFQYWERERERDGHKEIYYDQELELIIYEATTLTAYFAPKSTGEIYVYRWAANGMSLETNETLDLANRTYTARTTTAYTGNTTQKDAGIFGINIPNLTDNAGYTLQLVFSVETGAIEQFLTIPTLVEGGAHNISEYRTDTHSEIVILSGATLNIDQTTHVGKLSVYEGGVLNATTHLHADTLILWGNGTTGEHAQAYGTDNIDTQHLFYDCLLNKKAYYTLALPGNVNPDDITHANGDDVAIGVKHYDGNSRATGASGWSKLTSFAGFSFEAGKGYAVFATPRKWNGTLQTYAHVRFPLSGRQTESPNITVSTYAAAKPINANWNLVGNPQMADLNGVDNPNVIQFGYWAQNEEDGTYELKETAQRYIVQSHDHYKTYTHELAKTAQIPAFSSFFVQTMGSGTLTFSIPVIRRSIVAAPRHLTDSKEDNETAIGIVLQHAEDSDKAGILIGESFGKAYDFNADLGKLTSGAEQLLLYTLLDGTPLAFYATSEELAAQAIPLGFRTEDTNGTLRIVCDPAYDISNIEAMWLTDTETGAITNLLYEDYTFSTTQKQDDNRFLLAVVKRKLTDTTTANDNAATLQAYACSENGVLLIARIPEDTDIYIYDTTGRLVLQAPQCNNTLRCSLPEGNYLIRLQSTNHHQLIRTIVR